MHTRGEAGGRGGLIMNKIHIFEAGLNGCGLLLIILIVVLRLAYIIRD